MLPYWYEEIVPTLAASQVTLIVAHGSPLPP
jgi:bisphosphoglycerate-dependent phosphoglycerate mutase